jgi:aspartate carbamoyltransferase catalytic subunit
MTGSQVRSRRHLLEIADLGREGIVDLIELARHLADRVDGGDRADGVERDEPSKRRELAGCRVATLFFEASTRTRLSFETAARRLGAEVLTFTPETSSVVKGESLHDTVATLEALGMDLVVVRHRSAGVPHQIARRHLLSVVNGGDGWHEHPTQALLDCYTITEALHARGAAPASGLEGVRIAIVGDVKHSRVARSNVAAFHALGARVTLVAPPTMLPPSLVGWPVEIAHELDVVLGATDVCYLLRIQQERTTEALVPSLAEYTARFGLTAARANRLAPGQLVLHPGPINRGVEIAPEVVERPDVLVTRQVRNGVAVRMAVLCTLLVPEAVAAMSR